MQEPSVIHNTFVIERSFPKPPERVFSAFADPTKKRRWFAEGESHEIELFESDFRVGGTEHRIFAVTAYPAMAGSEGNMHRMLPSQKPSLRRRTWNSSIALATVHESSRANNWICSEVSRGVIRVLLNGSRTPGTLCGWFTGNRGQASIV